tara:strand:+ start:375 stop:893 length:519 start_codon:yes stop_codon:yes gene_type:complete
MDQEPDSVDETLPKPNELLALHDVTARLFSTLKGWFGVDTSITLDLESVDSAVGELGNPVMIAAMAMRKLQALNLISTPGVRTSTDVVITIVNDLDRALLQAPSMYLALKAEGTDWDAALADLGAGEDPDDIPLAADESDPELEEFQVQHAALHEAVHAVVEAGDGEIRYFE